MADQPPPAAPAANHRPITTVKLPNFWPAAAEPWFALAEAQFAIKGVEAELDKYYLAISALTEDTVDKVRHILQAPANDQSYAALKESLVATHRLTPYQQADKLYTMEPLGIQKPSDLLSTMLRYCPAGEETSHLFCYLFLEKLPREIRLQIGRAHV